MGAFWVLFLRHWRTRLVARCVLALALPAAHELCGEAVREVSAAESAAGHVALGPESDGVEILVVELL